MDQDSSLRIRPSEAVQQDVMKQIAIRLRDTPYILKGGSALVFTRGLDRHSTDLDFDASKKLNIKNRILDGLKAAGVQVNSIKAVKDTDTVQRFKVHYVDPTSGEDALFKVETSFRQPPKQNEVEVINGIQTYNVVRMFEQKMGAMEDRTEARDLYDVSHLLQNYGDQLSNAQIERVDGFSKDLNLLASRYEESFENDDVLMRSTDVENTVLALREAIEGQLQQRANLIEQPDLQMLAQQCAECLKLGGKQKGDAVEAEGKRYLIRSQNNVISITAKDGRGTIFEHSNEGVQSALNAEDIENLSQLESVNSRLTQKVQPPQQSSPRRSPKL